MLAKAFVRIAARTPFILPEYDEHKPGPDANADVSYVESRPVPLAIVKVQKVNHGAIAYPVYKIPKRPA